MSQRTANRLKRLGGRRNRAALRRDVGIPDDRKGHNRREIWVNDQRGEISLELRLPANGHDLNVCEAEVIPKRGLEEHLLVTPLDDEYPGPQDLGADPRTSNGTSRTPPSLHHCRRPLRAGHP